MSTASKSAAPRWRKEAILFGVLLFIGITILPIAVYAVGHTVFGTYGGGEYNDFHKTLLTGLLQGQWAVIFLVLSPYLLLQTLRMTIKAFRSRQLPPAR
ncbi:MAG: hypothetical protein RIA65_12515 [Woeseia sp.]